MVLLRRLPPFGDFLVCGISTQLHQRVAGFDEEIVAGDPEFAASGLKAASLIRLGFLAVLPDSALLGRIGSLSSTRRLRLVASLCAWPAAPSCAMTDVWPRLPPPREPAG